MPRVTCTAALKIGPPKLAPTPNRSSPISIQLTGLDEEVAELKAEITAGDLDKARGELGDLLFVMANLARKLGVEPEDALRGANAKFIRRFAFIEAELAKDGRAPEQSDLAEMDALWNAAKAAERSS